MELKHAYSEQKSGRIRGLELHIKVLLPTNCLWGLFSALNVLSVLLSFKLSIKLRVHNLKKTGATSMNRLQRLQTAEFYVLEKISVGFITVTEHSKSYRGKQYISNFLLCFKTNEMGKTMLSPKACRSLVTNQ